MTYKKSNNTNNKRSNLCIAAAAILAGASLNWAFTPPPQTTSRVRHENTVFTISTNGASTRRATTSTAFRVSNTNNAQGTSASVSASASTSISTDISEFLAGGTSNGFPLQSFPRSVDESSSPSSPLTLLEASMRSLPDHEQNTEFELKLGKAMDTLRKDYPDLLIKSPQFSIYDPMIEVVDPSGVTLHSLKSYKTSFQFLHMVVKLFYCPEQSGLQFRLIYDCARKNIRVSWNAILIPRAIYGGSRNRLHVDGISVYELDRKTGLIIQHRVEHLLVNDAPVTAPQGIFAFIANEAKQGGEGVGIPVFYGHRKSKSDNKMSVLEFKPSLSSLFPSTPTSLFSTSPSSSSSADDEVFDQEAFEQKNKSRRKFGLKPISEAEFIQIQVKTKELESTQKQKAAELASAASAAAAETAQQQKPKQNNFMNKLLGNVLQDTCESNFDCERPQVCCDFGFKKTCCSSGMSIFNGAPGQLRQIPVRVVADDHTYPRGGPGQDFY